MLTLAEVEVLARAEHMPYGQWVAKYERPVGVRRRKYKPGHCRYCGEQLVGRKTRFCSITCKRAAEKEVREK